FWSKSQNIKDIGFSKPSNFHVEKLKTKPLLKMGTSMIGHSSSITQNIKLRSFPVLLCFLRPCGLGMCILEKPSSVFYNYFLW
ncbi:hypothetical protein ACJX0J_041182, partial [Zea mays]